jgi:predicted Zn-dependent protease
MAKLTGCLLMLVLCVSSARGAVEFTPCKNNMAPEQQIRLGDKVAQQVYQQMPILADSSPVTAYVRDLGERLVAVAPGYRWP